MTKLIFFGSPKNSAELLEKLDSDERFTILAVVTQPDRPIGRKQILTPTPVAQYAEKNNIITLKPPCHPQKKYLIKNGNKLYKQIRGLLLNESEGDNFSDGSFVRASPPPKSWLRGNSRSVDSLRTRNTGGRKGEFETEEKFVPEDSLDLILSYEFGQLIPDEILKLPRLGALNIHFSLLPSYRGASPLAWQIANGEKETGISVIKMSTIFDQGHLIYQEKHPIKSNDTTQTLHQRLSARVLELLPDLLFNCASGNLTAYPHPKPRTLNLARKALYYPRLTRQTGYIPWKDFLLATGIKSDAFNEIESVALEIERKIRAFSPWPGVWTIIPPATPAQQSSESTLFRRTENLANVLTTKKKVHPNFPLVSKSKDLCPSNKNLANVLEKGDRGALLKGKRLKILSAKLENGKLVPLEVQLAGKKAKKWRELSDSLFTTG